MSNPLNDLTKVYLESVLLDEKKKEKKLDPVGQEDGDIDNDGDEDDSDEYLHAKRKAIGKAMGKNDKKKEKVEEGKNVHGRIEVPGKEPIEKQVKTAVSNVDNDVDGDTDHNDKSSGNYGEFVPSVDGKKKVTAGPAKAPKIKKESVYSWRDSISEFVDTPRNPNNKPMTSDKSREKISEKQVSNTIKINPVLKDVKEETLNEVTLVEEYIVEADDVDTIADFVFEELVEEGFDPIEIAAGLIEAKVTFGHDTKEPVNKEGPKRVAKSMARIVRRKLKRKVGQKSAEMQVAAYNKGREIMAGAKDKARVAKQKLKRGIKKAALKVADKMSEETNVDEAMRPGPRREKMRAKMHDPYVRGGSKSRGQAHNIAVRGDVSTGDPAIKSRGGGGVKKDKGMGYGDRGAGNKVRRRMGQEPLRGNTRKEEVEQLAANLQEKAQQCWDTHKKVGMKMKGGKLVNDCRPKNESVEVKESGETTAPTPQQTNIMKQRAMMDAKLAQLRRQQLNKAKPEDKKVSESTEDSLRDKRMERGGVDGNVRYDKPAKNVATGTGKKKSSGSSAFDFVKGELEKKYGKKAIISNKKG